MGTVPNNSGGGIPALVVGLRPLLVVDPLAARRSRLTRILDGYFARHARWKWIFEPDHHRQCGFESDGRDVSNRPYRRGAGSLGARAIASADDGGMQGVDLKQFLPGGARDPKTRLAGFGRRSEINAKEKTFGELCLQN